MATSKQEEKDRPKSKEFTALNKAKLVTLFAKVATSMHKKSKKHDKNLPDCS